MTGLGAALSLQLAAQQSLSQLSIQTIALLAEPRSVVEAMVDAALADNPALRRTQPIRCQWCALPLRGGPCTRCTGGRPVPPEQAAISDDPLATVRSEARLIAPVHLAPAVDLVIDALDERGLLPADHRVLGAATGFSGDEMDQALHAVRCAGPPGIAEPDSISSLRVQARWHAERGGPLCLPALVDDHLVAIADDALDEVAAALAQPVADIRSAVAFLRTRLTPAPVPRTLAAPPPAPPDLIIGRAADGGPTVAVPGARDLGLEFDPPTHVDLLPPAERTWWSGHVNRARELIALLDRRAATLQRIGLALTVLQSDFIRLGPAAHRPLTRSGLAAHLGLHASTVSRAVRHTVAALPDGRTIRLAEFFGGSVAAREYLAMLLTSDDPPVGDRAAAERLAAAGYSVARRTVAKYRAQIESRSGGSHLPRHSI